MAHRLAASWAGHLQYDRRRSPHTVRAYVATAHRLIHFLACYRELLEAGFTRIWSLHISSKLSGTFESARRAADELGGGHVRPVDTGTASLASGLLAEAIDTPLARGTTRKDP